MSYFQYDEIHVKLYKKPHLEGFQQWCKQFGQPSLIICEVLWILLIKLVRGDPDVLIMLILSTCNLLL